jgi:hypothetical protein
VSCDEVRERLPDHVLAMTPEPEDLEVRRHLRGCAGCRAELAALREGVEIFSVAVPPTEPPTELRDRVLGTLEEEWRDARTPSARSRFRASWLVAAAASLLLVVSVAWGLGQARRADRVQAGAASYERLLSTLGGTEFRVGPVRGVGGHDVRGSVLLYESVWGRSWGAVFLRAPQTADELTATLTGPGGFSLPFEALWTKDGETDGWLVTDADLGSVDRLTIRDASGRTIATARISAA